MRQIWDIHGGIHPPENKHQSTARPIRPAGIPKLLVLPLSQHIGAPAEPVVAAGDTVLKGQPIARAKGAVSVPLHAPTSGQIVGVEHRPVPHPSGMVDLCILLRPDGQDRWIEHAGTDRWRDLEPAELLQRIRDAGIAGMGGAGFPSAIKLSRQEQKPIDTLIINATECEPYITADDMLMRERAADVIAGVEILRHLVRPDQATIIGIEDNKPEAIAALQTAAAGLDIEVVVFPTKYPSGGEKQLIQILTGREVPSGKLPADIGIVCQNVGTTVAIHRAIVHGEPLLSRITTVTGDACREAGNFEVLLGTPLSHLLELCGFDAARCSRLVIGGPMMGYAIESPDVPVIKTTNCILAPTRAELPPPEPAQACIRCGLCAEACPASLLPQQLYWFARGQEWDKLEDHKLFDCIECGACSWSCPSHIPLVQYYRAGKAEIRKQAADKANAERAKARFEARQERVQREEMEKEARRRQRQQAARAGSGEADPIQAAVERAQAKKAARQQDPAQAAIERAKAARAPQPEQSPEDKAAAAVASVEKRLNTAQAKLAQAREQGSDKLAAFEQSVAVLEEKLVQAQAALSALQADHVPVPAPSGNPDAEDPAQAAIARALAQRASGARMSPEEKARQQVHSLQQRLAKSRDKLAAAQAEGSEHVELLTATVGKLEQQLELARAQLADPEANDIQ